MLASIDSVGNEGEQNDNELMATLTGLVKPQTVVKRRRQRRKTSAGRLKPFREMPKARCRRLPRSVTEWPGTCHLGDDRDGGGSAVGHSRGDVQKRDGSSESFRGSGAEHSGGGPGGAEHLAQRDSQKAAKSLAEMSTHPRELVGRFKLENGKREAARNLFARKRHDRSASPSPRTQEVREGTSRPIGRKKRRS
jgi:hypothetical protein